MKEKLISLVQRGSKKIVTLKNHAAVRKETIKLVKTADKSDD